MKKTVKTILLLLLTTLMFLSSIPVYATESGNKIMPRLTHTNEAAFIFDATKNIGYIDCSYTGVNASFVSAKLTVKVEKRFLLVFWSEVGTWSSTSTEVWGSFYHEMPFDGSGTYYRATFTLEVTGKDGTVDVITDTIENGI